MTSHLRAVLHRFGTAFAGLLVVSFFSAFADGFATLGNLAIVLKETSVLAILSIGFALALTTAELDLSIAEIASLAAVTVGAAIHAGADPAFAVLTGLGVGLGGGLLNGFAVTVLNVPSLIATLGTAAMARGFGFMITQGVAFVGRWPQGFTRIARGAWLGVPNLVWWMALIAGSAWVLLAWTRTGVHMIATGEADEAGSAGRHPHALDEAFGAGAGRVAGGGGSGVAGIQPVVGIAGHGQRLLSVCYRRGAFGHDDDRTGAPEHSRHADRCVHAQGAGQTAWCCSARRIMRRISCSA